MLRNDLDSLLSFQEEEEGRNLRSLLFLSSFSSTNLLPSFVTLTLSISLSPTHYLLFLLLPTNSPLYSLPFQKIEEEREEEIEGRRLGGMRVMGEERRERERHTHDHMHQNLNLNFPLCPLSNHQVSILGSAISLHHSSTSFTRDEQVYQRERKECYSTKFS